MRPGAARGPRRSMTSASDGSGGCRRTLTAGPTTSRPIRGTSLGPPHSVVIAGVMAGIARPPAPCGGRWGSGSTVGGSDRRHRIRRSRARESAGRARTRRSSIEACSFLNSGSRRVHHPRGTEVAPWSPSVSTRASALTPRSRSTSSGRTRGAARVAHTPCSTSRPSDQISMTAPTSMIRSRGSRK